MTDFASPATPPPLSREESLYLDGALPAEASRRLEEQATSDPALRARLDAWRETASLWKEDALRASSAIDPEAVLRRALSGGEAGPAAVEAAAASRAYRRYARAAVVLLTLGAGGSALLAASEAWTEESPREDAVGAVEKERMELQGTLEMLALPVARPRARGE